MVENQILTQYSNFLRLMGHRVVQTSSSLWIDVRYRVFQPAPPFHLPQFERDEVRKVFKETNAIACRWFEDRNSVEEEGSTGTTLYVAREPYDVAHLPHNARHQTRRGLERIEVRRQDMDTTVEPLTFAVYSDTVKRLGLMRTDTQVVRKWQTWVRAIREASGVELWTGWHEGKMVAFAVTIDTPWGTEFVLTRSVHAALKLYPNNALIYTITKEALTRGAGLVSLGLNSYAGEKRGLHNFKVNMGYQPISLIEKQAWHPIVRPFSPLLSPERLRAMYRLVSRTT